MDTTLTRYQEYLNRLPLSRHTRRAYITRVKGYLEWLRCSPDGEKALVDPIERNFAVGDYKNRLLQQGRSGATVNAILSAVDNLYLFLGLGAARVKRQNLPPVAPRALEPEEHRRFLKAVARCRSLRNRAMVLVLLHCGLRLSELTQLNVSDLALTARIKELVVRCGKGSKRRIVPLNSEVAEVLRVYLSSRAAGGPESPLFLSQKGNRISPQAVDYLVRELGKESGVEVSAHRLRHDCLTRLVRSGCDLVIVAQVAGHSRLETTMRYSLPSEHDKLSAMERLVNYAT